MKPLVTTVLLLSATLGCGEGGQIQPETTGALANAQVGDAFDGPVVSITDGDTISVLRGGEQVRVRVEGIDTPESDQAFGAQATAFTSALLRNKRVAVHVRDVDRYRRLVSRVQVDGIDLSVALVTEGLAWHYTQYSDDPVLAAAEAQARAAKIGLWSQSSPVRPWEFRRGVNSTETDVSDEDVLRGNRRSKVFHRASCRNYRCQNCTVMFDSTDEALAAGFRPAGDCHRDR